MADVVTDGVAPLTAAELKDEMWREIARYQPGALPPRQTSQALPVAASAPDLGTLLSLDGKAFAEAAYRALLGRPADEAGMAYCMRELAAGTSKIVLLGQLQSSREGRQAGRVLRGLGPRYLAHRLYRLPVAGGAARLAGALLRRTGVSRMLAGVSPGRASQAPRGRRSAGQPGRAEQEAQSQTMGRLAALEDANQRMAATIATQGRTMSGLLTQFQSGGRRLAGLEDSSLEAMLAMSDTLASQAARLAALDDLLSGEAVAARIDAGAAALRQSLDERLDRAEATVERSRQLGVDQERRIGLILETLRSRRDAMPEPLEALDDEAVASLYVDFEDRFRGTRDDIKQRQKVYLPILADAQAGSPARPVVDVGCGRGEFLELLREQGLVGRGVDANAAMAAACRDRGLDCVADDALAYLGRQPPGSLGAVTGFHIIEHLPFKTMVRLFDQALHALAPGGLMVFETPNPANLLVASRWFYLDPTHRNPLPGEMVAMIAEARGFCRISLVDLHPMAQRFGGADPVLREQLDRLFHGPQDYALLARKP